MWLLFFFFKQKSAYERRISDWISDVCSSDLGEHAGAFSRRAWLGARRHGLRRPRPAASGDAGVARPHQPRPRAGTDQPGALAEPPLRGAPEPHLFPERLRRAHRAEGDADWPPGPRSGAERKTTVSGKSVYERGDLGGRRINKKKKK